MSDYPDYAVAKTTKFQPTLLRPGDTLTMTLTLNVVGRDHLSAPVRFDHIDYVLHGVYVEPEAEQRLVSDYVVGGFMDVPGDERLVPLAEVGALIDDLTDSEPCWYDHKDNCQTHSLHKRPCPHERAKTLLAEFGDGER